MKSSLIASAAVALALSLSACGASDTGGNAVSNELTLNEEGPADANLAGDTVLPADEGTFGNDTGGNETLGNAATGNDAEPLTNAL